MKKFILAGTVFGMLTYHRAFPSLTPAWLVAGLAAALAAGCAPLPDVGPKPVPRAPDSIAAVQSLPATPEGAWPAERWWQAYGDAQLDALIAEGLNGSPDVAAAAARLRRAGGLAQQAGAARLPSLDVSGQANIEKQSYNNGFPKEFLPQGWQDTGQAAASLAFDLDVWGRNRAALAAATSEERAAAIDARQAQLTLATAIASAYADLARLFEERDVRQGELDIRSATQRLVAQRQANGLETRGSLRQSDSQAATARAALAAADQAIAVRRNQIAALVGAGPDRGLAIARPTLAGPVLAAAGGGGLPEGVTTDLVGRRPDIAAARERVEAAASRIKVARADFFPALRLNALIGVQSLGLENLVSSDSTYGRVGPAISLPIFHGGALQGRYRADRASYDEAVADYDRTVLAAYQQTADAVSGRRLLAEQLARSAEALAAAEDAYAVAQSRYRGGLSSYLDVLTVEDRLLQARLAHAGIAAAARAIDIELIRALGGGFGPASASVSAPAAANNAKDAPNG